MNACRIVKNLDQFSGMIAEFRSKNQMISLKIIFEIYIPGQLAQTTALIPSDFNFLANFLVYKIWACFEFAYCLALSNFLGSTNFASRSNLFDRWRSPVSINTTTEDTMIILKN